MFFVVGVNSGLLLVDVIFEDLHFTEFLKHSGVSKGDCGHVDVDATFDATASRFAHSAPVFKGVGDKGVGGDGANGFVPVLDFNSVNGNFDNIAVGTIFGHFDPVTFADHIVCSELNSSDESEDGVFKHEHGDGGESAEEGEEMPGFFVE